MLGHSFQNKQEGHVLSTYGCFFRALRYLSAVVFMIAFTSVTAWAQTSKIDSLLNQLESTQLDTSRVWLLNDLSYAYYQFSADSTLKYARLALALSESLHYPMGLVKSYGNLGVGMPYYRNWIVPFIILTRP